jgi:glutamate:GABA antiporter
MAKKVSLFSLVLLIIAAIDSIRNLPATALFGSALILFFIFSAIVFLIPTSLVAAELSATFPEKGGVYHWVRTAFGDKAAMLAIWLQWINTMVWYPTILSFIAGTAAYLINPALAQNQNYLVISILIVFWGITFLNFFGLRVSARVNNACALIGTMFPMILLIILGAIWIFSGKPQQISVNTQTVFPALDQSTSWISIIAIMASFLGMELSGVHVNDIRDPQRNYPKAMLFASVFILLSMMLGSLAIAYVLPAEQINLVAGVMQVFSNFFDVFHMRWCIPVLTVMIVIGSIGSIINWLISPAKGLLHAAEFGFMPPFFAKKNKYGVASRILLAQAIVVSIFCTVFLLVPSINAFYWFLTALSTELYMVMYVLMFLAAIRLHYRYINRPKAFKIPGGNFGIWLTSLLGLFGCLTTIIVGFFPPDHIQISSTSKYAWMIGFGNLLMITPVFLFYLYKRRSQN